jgi:hypothetical protein
MGLSAVVQTVGLPKLYAKLNVDYLTTPAQTELLQELTEESSTFLAQQLADKFPVTSSSVMATATSALGKITANRFPYVFFERGSQYPVAAPAIRSHRTRRGVKNNALRIRPRRYLSQTRSLIRRSLPGLLDKMRQRIEQRWAE